VNGSGLILSDARRYRDVNIAGNEEYVAGPADQQFSKRIDCEANLSIFGVRAEAVGLNTLR